MDSSKNTVPLCPEHGKPTNRDTCRNCNAAYMRHYQKQRRRTMPGRAMWERALKRAINRNLEFALPKDSVFVPRNCPVLGIAITPGSKRAASSPSLDRILPMRGYVPDNVRVICDHANRLKGDRSLDELKGLAEHGPLEFRADYRMIVTYLEREMLLREVREKAKQEGRAGREWARIALFLDRLFRKSLIRDGGPLA
jgi:hypothetical protein